MIITCNECEAKYLLADEKVPQPGVRVRCPKCRFVWRLTPPAREAIFEVSTSEFASEAPVSEGTSGGWAAMDQPAVATPETSAVAMEEQAAHGIGEDAVIDAVTPEPPAEEKQESPELRKKTERAKRLARVFVSDILVYNKEKRDKGLADGDLMTVLGPEIKKSWEAYKEKIGPEFVESNDYFRDALNEILTDGQKIF